MSKGIIELSAIKGGLGFQCDHCNECFTFDPNKAAHETEAADLKQKFYENVFLLDETEFICKECYEKIEPKQELKQEETQKSILSKFNFQKDFKISAILFVYPVQNPSELIKIYASKDTEIFIENDTIIIEEKLNQSVTVINNVTILKVQYDKK